MQLLAPFSGGVLVGVLVSAAFGIDLFPTADGTVLAKIEARLVETEQASCEEVSRARRELQAVRTLTFFSRPRSSDDWVIAQEFLAGDGTLVDKRELVVMLRRHNPELLLSLGSLDAIERPREGRQELRGAAIVPASFRDSSP